MSEAEPSWLTIQETADRWRVSYDTVRRMIASGEVLAKKIGRQWRVHETAVAAFEQDGKVDRSDLVVQTNWLGL